MARLKRLLQSPEPLQTMRERSRWVRLQKPLSLPLTPFAGMSRSRTRSMRLFAACHLNLTRVSSRCRSQSTRLALSSRDSD
ncbi:hypothetical protein M408DRAFT_84853 [Serendipita vermifera MAFF 305830]|uniref:Uncharacterized protein n=1 Tax=Serendipita vermifera MAFF 305830 TaxID=933852 RepID=A0A0C3BNU2_SERVB|nr:hypothetical protein M408DRAFT_84853 [Serendipita vermifera MAFF 305830]